MDIPNTSFDLKDLIQFLWKEKKTILKTIVIFLIIGLFVAFCSKRVYKSECNFIYDDEEGGSRISGLLSQFSSLAGVNLNTPQGIINSEVIPKISQSTPFLIEIMHTPIKISTIDTTITVYQYFSKIESSSLIGTIFKTTVNIVKGLIPFSNKQQNQYNFFVDTSKIIILSREEEEILKKLSESIEIVLDDKTGLIYLRVYLKDPVGAAELNQIVYNKLMGYIIKYKVNKAKEDYDFIYARYNEAKAKYEKVQNDIATFRDQNKNIVSAYYKTREDQLQNEYALAFNVYNGLAQQLEQAKIHVQEAMPVFHLIEKANVPLKPAKPNKPLILLLFIFLGFFTSLGILIFKIFYLRIKEVINSPNVNI